MKLPFLKSSQNRYNSITDPAQLSHANRKPQSWGRQVIRIPGSLMARVRKSEFYQGLYVLTSGGKRRMQERVFGKVVFYHRIYPRGSVQVQRRPEYFTLDDPETALTP